MLTEREQKGLQIAALAKIHRNNVGWWVPSQSGNGKYLVVTDRELPFCTCPDYESRQERCKHIYAVEFTLRRETKADGTTTVTKTMRVTYKQDWPAYNAAQTHEQPQFERLLRSLCEGIQQPPQQMGRPRLAMSDMVFTLVSKVYSTKSGRRFAGALHEAEMKGLIGKAADFSSGYRYLENPALTPILKALVEESASPLKAVESDFAVDASGFATSVYSRWYDAKYGKVKTEQQWLKAHLMVGVKTNVVTSVEVTDGNANDSPYLPQLVNATASRFQIEEVSGDKAYISKRNLAAVVAVGAVPYIPFKENTTGEGPELWRKMYHFYQYNRQTFLTHYHKRSNVETTFSMIKGKFGGAVRSKTPVAQNNEVLCKVLAHNICCLISSIYELGLEPTFASELALDATVA